MSEVLKKIEEDRLDEAIVLLKREIESKFSISNSSVMTQHSSTLSGLTNRLNSLNRNNLLGIINRSDFVIEKNQICHSLITLSKEVQTQNSLTKETAFKSYSTSEIIEVKQEIEDYFNSEPLRKNRIRLFNDLSKTISHEIIPNKLKSTITNWENKLAKTQYSLDDFSDGIVKDIKKDLEGLIQETDTKKQIKNTIVEWIEFSVSTITNHFSGIYQRKGLEFERFCISYKLIYSATYFETIQDIQEEVQRIIINSIHDDVSKIHQSGHNTFATGVVGVALAGLGLTIALLNPIFVLAGFVGGFGTGYFLEKNHKENKMHSWLNSFKGYINNELPRKLEPIIHKNLSNDVEIKIYLEKTLTKWFDTIFLEQIENLNRHVKN